MNYAFNKVSEQVYQLKIVCNFFYGKFIYFFIHFWMILSALRITALCVNTQFPFDKERLAKKSLPAGEIQQAGFFTSFFASGNRALFIRWR
jgi:hypothetical protein